jgi:signal transduction histidine kinase
LLLALSYVLGVALVGLGLPLVVAQRSRIVEVEEQAVQARAKLTAAMAADAMDAPGRSRLHDLVRVARLSLLADAGPDPLARVLVVDRAGRRVADSNLARPPAQLREFPRGELDRALRGDLAQERRQSKTLGAEIRVTAAPAVRAGAVMGAVRVTQSGAVIDARLAAARNDTLWLPLGLSASIVAMGLLVATYLARLLVRPLQSLESAVNEVARGSTSVRAPLTGSREQRALAGAFNDMAERLEAMRARQEAFVANASHQLKTPLTSLRLRLMTAGRRSPGDERGRRDLREAELAVDRLKGIVDDLLTLSRLGGHPSAASMVDLNAAGRDAVHRWAPAAEHAKIRLVARPSPQECPVSIAPADLERILDALLENALMYAPADSTVVLATTPSRLEILDEGPGFAPGEEAQMFERFGRGQAGLASGQGSGLGLAIAREVAERWRASLMIGNRPEGGAVARIAFANGPEPDPTKPEALHGLELPERRP